MNFKCLNWFFCIGGQCSGFVKVKTMKDRNVFQLLLASYLLVPEN